MSYGGNVPNNWRLIEFDDDLNYLILIKARLFDQRLINGWRMAHQELYISIGIMNNFVLNFRTEKGGFV